VADQDTGIKNLQRRVERLEQQLKVVADHAGANEVLAELDDKVATGKERRREDRATEESWEDL
jgi:hypothetical protein